METLTFIIKKHLRLQPKLQTYKKPKNLKTLRTYFEEFEDFELIVSGS